MTFKPHSKSIDGQNLSASLSVYKSVLHSVQLMLFYVYSSPTVATAMLLSEMTSKNSNARTQNTTQTNHLPQIQPIGDLVS